MAELLLGNWDADRRGYKFCDPQYRQRSKRSFISRQVTDAETSKDLQRPVLQWHMPLNNRGRWCGYATPVS